MALGGDALVKAGRALAVLGGLGYLGFDVFALLGGSVALPTFIIVENLVYAAVYLAGAALYRDPRVRLAVALVAAFNAGRVSRSIVTSVGTMGELALQHLPLFLGLLALALVSGAASLASGGSSRRTR